MAIDDTYGCPNDGDVRAQVKEEALELAITIGRACDDKDDELADELCSGCREVVALSGLSHALAVALAMRCERRDNPTALIDTLLEAIRVDALARIRRDQAGGGAAKKETRH